MFTKLGCRQLVKELNGESIRRNQLVATFLEKVWINLFFRKILKISCFLLSLKYGFLSINLVKSIYCLKGLTLRQSYLKQC